MSRIREAHGDLVSGRDMAWFAQHAPEATFRLVGESADSASALSRFAAHKHAKEQELAEELRRARLLLGEGRSRAAEDGADMDFDGKIIRRGFRVITIEKSEMAIIVRPAC